MNPTHPFKYPARFISYLFHPVFVPFYLTAFLLRATPQVFAANSDGQQTQLLLNVFINLVLFPLLVVFLLKQLKFADSYMLHSRKERIIPVFTHVIFTFWVWAFVLLKNPAGYPHTAVRMGLAFFLGASLTLICNSFYKISLHAIGAGMITGLFTALAIAGIAPWLWTAMAALIAVLIIYSRVVAGRHSAFELYSGFMVGLLPQLLCQVL